MSQETWFFSPGGADKESADDSQTEVDDGFLRVVGEDEEDFDQGFKNHRRFESRQKSLYNLFPFEQNLEENSLFIQITFSYFLVLHRMWLKGPIQNAFSAITSIHFVISRFGH